MYAQNPRAAELCSSGAYLAGSELGAQICPETKRLYDFNLDKAAIGSTMSWSPDYNQFAELRLAPLAARPRGRDLQPADVAQYRRAAPSATAHC